MVGGITSSLSICKDILDVTTLTVTHSNECQLLQRKETMRPLTPDFSYQETFEKASLSSSSSGAASLKSELSESTELPGEGCHASCGKEEDRLCEEVLSEDNFQLESVEKGGCALRRGGQEGTRDLLRLGSPSSSFLHTDLYSELDYEPDVSDNCSSSSSSPLKESTFSKLAVQVCLCVTAVGGAMAVRGSMESVTPVSGVALQWVEPEARHQERRGCFFIFTRL